MLCVIVVSVLFDKLNYLCLNPKLGDDARFECVWDGR